MKKPVLFFVMLLIAALGLFVMDYFSSSGKGDAKPGETPDPPVVKEFKVYCDSLANAPWNPQEYYQRKNKLKVYVDEQVVDVVQGFQLEEYMNYRYAKSIEKSFNIWKSNAGDSALLPIENEAKTVSSWSGCSSVLATTISEIALYHRMRSIPARFNQMIAEERNEQTCQRLLTEIMAMPGPFTSSDLTLDREMLLQELNAFSTFCVEFDDSYNLFQLDSDDFQNREKLKGFCPANYEQIRPYTHYVSKIQNTGICPDYAQ
jgi:hypothetical protein